MRSIVVGLAFGFIVAAFLVRAAPATLEWSIQSPFESCVSDGNDFIACANDTALLSINPLNGSTLWQLTDEAPGGYGMTLQFCPQHPELAFLASAGTGTGNGSLSAVSKSTGTVLWSFDTLSTFTNQITTQCFDDGALVYVIAPNNFFAVDVRTGGLKWLQYVNTSSQYQLVEVPDRTKAATTKSSSLFFADSQGLHRVDSATGKPLPFVPSNASIVVQNLPFGVVGTVALFATTQNTVAAMTSDGTLLWSTSLPIDQVVGDVLISYPSLSSTSQIQSLNASTGETLWMVHLSSSSNPQLAASNNKFIVYSYASTNGNYTTIGRLEARELSTGNVSWSLENLATEFGNTWASKDYLGFVAPNGGITGISIASGTNRTLPLLSPLNGLIEAKKLLIVQNDTNAFAFRKW